MYLILLTITVNLSHCFMSHSAQVPEKKPKVEEESTADVPLSNDPVEVQLPTAVSSTNVIINETNNDVVVN